MFTAPGVDTLSFSLCGSVVAIGAMGLWDMVGKSVRMSGFRHAF